MYQVIRKVTNTVHAGPFRSIQAARVRVATLNKETGTVGAFIVRTS